MQCDHQYCCHPIQDAENHQIDLINNGTGSNDCGAIEAATFADPRVQAVFGACGCACLDCCYDGFEAEAPQCGRSLCGNGTIPTGGDNTVIG